MEQRRRRKSKRAVDTIKLNTDRRTSLEEEEFVKYGAVDEFYNLMDEIGRGAYATVKKCVQKETGNVYAVKTIKAANHNIRKDVNREIELMRKLGEHSKLVQLYQAYQTPFEIAMVLEYIPGGELFERIVEEEYLMEDDAIYYVRQVLEALQYMHDKNIVHLDIKPENIMCVDKHTHGIKLVDFGLARELSGSEDVKSSFGTPDFVAPEVIRMQAVTTASDMWSVGVVTYVLLSGLMPFSGDDDHQTLVKVAKAEWDWEDECFDDLTEDAKEFIEGLLQKDKGSRYTVEECLRHKWIKEKRTNQAKINTQKHRAFMAKRRWKKSVNALVAVRRMSLSPMAGRAARRNSAEPPTLGPTAEKFEDGEQNTKRQSSHSESNVFSEYRQDSRSRTYIGLDMSTVRLLKDQLTKEKAQEDADKIMLTISPESPEGMVGAEEQNLEQQNGAMHSVDGSSLPTYLDAEVSRSGEEKEISNENSSEHADDEETSKDIESSEAYNERSIKSAGVAMDDCHDINGNLATMGNILQGSETSDRSIGYDGKLLSHKQGSVSAPEEIFPVDKTSVASIHLSHHDGEESELAVLSASVGPESGDFKKFSSCSVTINLNRYEFTSSDKAGQVPLPHVSKDEDLVPSINVIPSSPTIPRRSPRGKENVFDTASLTRAESISADNKYAKGTITVKLDQCSSLNVSVKQVSHHVRRASTGSPAIEFSVPFKCHVTAHR